MIPAASERRRDGGAWTRAGAAIAVTGTLAAVLPIADRSLDRHHLPKELALELGALIALAGVRGERSFDAVDRALGLVALTTIVSALAAIEPFTAARAAAITLAGASLAFAVRRLDPASRAWLRRLAIGGVVMVAALALAEVLGLARGLSDVGRAPGATLGQRNAVAHVAALASPFVGRSLQRATLRRERVLAALALAVLVAAIVATRCRAAWIAAPVSMLVLAACAARERRGWGGAVAPVGMAGLVAGLTGLVRPRLSWHASRPYHDTFVRLVDTSTGSGLGRVVQARASLGLVPQHPILGVGPGNWSIAYPSVTPTADPSFHADAWEPTGRLLTNDFVAWLVERGLVGAVALWWLARVIVRARRATPAWIAMLSALVVLCALDSVLQLAAPVALVVALGALPPATEARAPARDARGLLGAVALVLVLAIGQRAIELAALDLHASEHATYTDLERARAISPGDYAARAALADAYLRQHRCDQARDVLEEAVRLRPEHPMVRRALEAARGCARGPGPGSVDLPGPPARALPPTSTARLAPSY